MKCREVQDLIVTDFLDGEASSEKKARVEEHLSGCVSCREYFSIVSKMESGLQSAPVKDAPEHLWGVIRDKIQETPVTFGEMARGWWEDVLWGFRPTFVYGSLAAATLVILIVLVPLVGLHSGSDLASVDKAQIAQVAYLSDDDSAFLQETEKTASGTVLDHWL